MKLCLKNPMMLYKGTFLKNWDLNFSKQKNCCKEKNSITQRCSRLKTWAMSAFKSR